MNESQDNNNVAPYKASGNLNTMLSNPSANINNTMNVNIQNVNEPVNNQNNNSSQNVSVQNSNVNTVNTSNNTNVNNNANSAPTPNNQNVVNPTTNNVNRTFVNEEPKKQKKTVKITYSPELKIAIFIVVLLLVFLMFIPVIENFIGSLLP